MMKQNLLLVDDDAKGLRVMEVSLRNAGHTVTTAANGHEALQKLDLARPALILSDTSMPGMDGYELCRRVKGDERYRDIPFIFLTEQTAIEDKIRGLELGADDYLTKPIYIKEVVTRVSIALQKRERSQLERKDKRRFFGSLEDMGMVDLLQTIELGRKSGLLTIDRPPHTARLYFGDGQVLDAETGRLRGEDAVYRLLTWEDGNFEIDFKSIDRPRRIQTTTQGLLMEGMRRVDEWGRLLEQLPSINTIYQVDYSELAEHLAELPDEVNALLRLFDGHRTALQAIDDAQMGDLEALAAISRLYFEGVIYEAGLGRVAEKAETRPASPEAARADGVPGAKLEEWLSDVLGEPAAPDDDELLVPTSRAAPMAEPALATAWVDALDDPETQLPSQGSGLIDELLSSASAIPAFDADEGIPREEEPDGLDELDALMGRPPKRAEVEDEVARSGLVQEAPEPARGAAPGAARLMTLESPEDEPEVRPPLPPATPPPDMVRGEDSERVRKALALKLDELPPDAFAPEPEPEPEPTLGALPLEALPETAPLPTPPPAPLRDGEEVFFEGPAHRPESDLPFEIHRDGPVSPAAYLAAGFLGLLVLGGGIYWGVRDTVTPIPPQQGVLEETWHEAPLKAQAARTAKEPVPALEADWRAVRPAEAPHEAPASAAGSEPAPGSGAPASEGPAPTSVAVADARPPTQPAPETQGKFKTLMDEGLALQGKHKFREASDRFERAISLAPGNATALLAYAQVLMELDRGTDALEAAEKCAAIEPGNARAWLVIGSIKQDKGQRDAAVEAYQRYLKLAPTDNYAEDVRRVMENIR